MSATINVRLQITFDIEEGITLEQKEAQILQYLRGVPPAVKNLYDHEIAVSPATANSSLSGEHNLNDEAQE